MPLASRFAMESFGYLLLDTLPTALALPAQSVIDIAPMKHETPEQPSLFSDLVPIRFAASSPLWVLHVVVEGQQRPVLISGAVHLVYRPANSLLAMPELHRQSSNLFSELILTDGVASALVVNIDALFLARRELGT